MPDREAASAHCSTSSRPWAGPAAGARPGLRHRHDPRRLLERFPEARSIAVDVDPALLTIAGATLGDDERVRCAGRPGRSRLGGELPETPVDAVLTATALHWLPEPLLRRLYRDLAGIVRPGGAVANADEMPPTCPGWAQPWPLSSAAGSECGRRPPGLGRLVGHRGRRPALADAVAERRAPFGGVNHPAEFTPRRVAVAQADAGFEEAGVSWRSGAGAVVAAVR